VFNARAQCYQRDEMQPRHTMTTVASLALFACAGSQPASSAATAREVVSARAIPAALDAGPAVADAAADSALGEATTLAVVSGPLSAGVGVIFAADPTASVTLTPEQRGVAPIALRDGERVRYLEVDAMMGVEHGTALIEARGVRGRVANGAVITEERLRRSPDGRWAVFSAIESCGDFCHSGLRLLSLAQRRDLCDAPLCAGPDPIVAWSADGRSLVVDSHGVRVIALGALAVRAVSSVGSPVFSPAGRLFVRGVTEDDGVFEVTDAPEPRRVFGASGRAAVSTADSEVAPPTQVVFEGDGAVLCAGFLRGRQVRYARASLDGRPVAGRGPCAR
jgi:hypothetical protein